jgi:S1-C subfamily serine protease
MRFLESLAASVAVLVCSATLLLSGHVHAEPKKLSSIEMLSSTARLEGKFAAGTGTVVAIKRRGGWRYVWLVTNNHVAKNFRHLTEGGYDQMRRSWDIEEISVTWYRYDTKGWPISQVTYPGRVVAGDDSVDLALVFVRVGRSEPVRAARFSNASQRVALLDTVYAVGVDFFNKLRVVDGKVSQIAHMSFGVVIEHTAPTRPGHSGGSLWVFEGNNPILVGINTAVSVQPIPLPDYVDGLGLMVSLSRPGGTAYVPVTTTAYAIPTDAVRAFLRRHRVPGF